MKKTYRAARMAGPVKLEVREVDLPRILPSGYFMSDVNYTSICGSDRGMWNGGAKTITIGHELSVTVTDPGDTDLKVGDRIAMFPAIPCGECEFCRNGMDNICPGIFARNYTGISADGGYAEKYMGPAKYAVKLPDNVESTAGALIEPTATAYHAIRRSGIKAGDKVLVIGAGGIGQLVAEWAKYMGASYTAVTEYNHNRLMTARNINSLDGYYEATDPELDAKLQEASGGGFDLVFDCAASAAGYATGAAALKPMKKIVFVGTSFKPVGIVPQSLLGKETTVITSMSYTFEEYRECVEHVAAGHIDPCKVITKIVPLDAIQETFETLFNDPDDANVKVLVKPN